MFGTLVVVPSDPSREELAVKGPCHTGNTDWTQLRLEFQTTDDGRAYVLCCLCGQGIGKGTVWFDDLRIVPIERLTATQTAPAASQPASRPAGSRPAPAASQP
jgi:hypothetical protein